MMQTNTPEPDMSPLGKGSIENSLSVTTAAKLASRHDILDKCARVPTAGQVRHDDQRTRCRRPPVVVRDEHCDTRPR